MAPLGSDPLRIVFVYGTLREGFANRGRDVLTTHGSFLGEATAPGGLYDLGDFPAMVGPGGEDDRVSGEVYELEHQPERALERLDRYEGARGDDPLPYERREIEVRLADGGRRRAWTYVWTGDLADAPRVKGDDWVAHVRAREETDSASST